jgi:hypothetical protein
MSSFIALIAIIAPPLSAMVRAATAPTILVQAMEAPLANFVQL